MSLTLQTVTAAEKDQFRQNTAIRQIIEVLQINGLISANAGQLAFPATQNPSSDVNTLDDYEEGTWVPAIIFSGTGLDDTSGDLSVVYSVRVGKYLKIGRLVHVTVQLVTSTFTHTTATGFMMISGLPFPIQAEGEGFGTLQFQGITKANYTQFSLDALGGSSRLASIACGQGQAQSNVLVADMPTGGTVLLQTSLQYFTAN